MPLGAMLTAVFIFRVGVDATQQGRLEDAEHAFSRVLEMAPNLQKAGTSARPYAI